MTEITDKAVALTGASSGIGQALALRLAAEGCRLALADRDADGLEATAKLCRNEDVAVSTHILDVADRAAVETFADEAIAEHGGIDIVINNAGVTMAQSVTEIAYEDFEWVMNVNFWGMVYGSRAFLPHFRARGSGHVVNVSSIFGIIAFPKQGAYNCSKFAVRAFTESLRIDLAETPIQVTSVHPGGIRTNIMKNARYPDSVAEGTKRRWEKAFDQNVFTSAEEAAGVILDGIRRNRTRVLIGPDARRMDIVQRLFPGRYEQVAGLLASPAKLLKRLGGALAAGEALRARG